MPISGSGLLIKSGAGNLTLSGTNSYSGPTSVTTGILQYNVVGAIAGTGRNITVSSGATVALGYVPAGSIQTDLLSRIVATSAGALGLTAAASPVTENLDFSTGGPTNNFTALSLGAIGSATYTGTLTPNANTYRLGGGGGTLTFNPGGGTFDNTQNLVIFGNGNTGTVDFGAASRTFGAVSIRGGTTQNGTITGSSFSADLSTAGATVSASLAGAGAGLTKSGIGTLTLNGSAIHTYTGATTVNAGTLALDFVNLTGSSPFTDLINSGSALSFGGGLMTIRSRTGGSNATAQTFNGVTVNAGGGSLLVDPNGGLSSSVTLGSLGTLSSWAAGSSLALGKAITANTGAVNIITSTNMDGTGIYGGRVVFANGTANTGYDWATVASGAGPFTLGAYATGSYAALNLTAGTDTVNSRITASQTLGGARITNSFKIENPAASQTLALGTNLLTLTSGGLLSTGTNAMIISGTAGSTTLTASNSSGAYDLVVHQYNSGGLTISAQIGDANAGANATSLSKAGIGTLVLSGANSYTGQTYVNAGILNVNNATGLGTAAAGTTVYAGASLQLASGFSVGAEALTLNGTGVNNDGALRSMGGDKSFAGAITLGSSARINSDNNTWQLTHASGITGTNTDLAMGVTAGGSNVTGPVSLGSGAFTKDGAGTWNLNSAGNSWTGPTTINAGTLVVSGSSGAWSVGNTIAINGATSVLQINGTQIQGTNFGFNIQGTGILRSAGTVILRGANSYSGGTTVAAANDHGISFDNAGSLGTGLITFTNSTSYLASTDATAHTLANRILFSTASSSTGYRFGTWGSANRGTGNLTFTGLVNISGASPIIGVDTGTTTTFSGEVSSNGVFGITKNGAGTLVLSGASTYSGVTTVSQGILNVGALAAVNTPSSIGTGSFAGSNADLILNGGTLQYTVATAATPTATDRLFSIGTTGGTFDSSSPTLTNTISFTGTGAMGFNGQTGARTLTLTGTNAGANTMATIIGDNSGATALTKSGIGIWAISGTNTYTGATLISAGTLKLGAAGSGANSPLGTTAAGTSVTATGGALDLNGFTLATAEPLSIIGTGVGTTGALINSGVAASYSGVVTIGTGGARIGGTGDIALSSGLATNANALTKVGANTLALNAASSRTGATTISAGTINQGATNALGTGTPALSITPTTGTGLYNMSGAFAQTVGLVTLGGASGTTASITTGTGTLTMGGNLTYDETNDPNGATISGLLNLGTTQKTFAIGNSSAADDVTVTAAVSNGVGGSILKTGLGTLRLDGSQAYDTLTVNDGTTNVNGSLTTLTAAVTVTDSGNGTKLRFGSVSQTLSSLTIGAGATVIFTSGPASGSLTGGGKAAGFGSPASSFGPGASGSTVPEPGTIGLLLVGALGMLNRRRRHA